MIFPIKRDSDFPSKLLAIAPSKKIKKLCRQETLWHCVRDIQTFWHFPSLKALPAKAEGTSGATAEIDHKNTTEIYLKSTI